MIDEVWYYKVKLPNNDEYKYRPVLIIGNDSNNNLLFSDIHYDIISSSSSIGLYDVLIDDLVAKKLGLSRKSVIKTTKIYTGPKNYFERKVCDLPIELKREFLQKYQEYQNSLISQFNLCEFVEQ